MSTTKMPFHVMIKPIGAKCNLRCDYCFYLDKTTLYPKRHGVSARMNDEMLETLISQLIAARVPGQDEVMFAWQGGEPALMGLAFFEKAVLLQNKLAPRGVRITNTFQTNGVLIDDEYARFFRDHGFLVGISIDGPQAIHDRFRRDAKGHGSFADVMNGIDTLHRHGVEYNLMSVVHQHNAPYPEEIYDFLRQLGTPFLQLIPLVEPDPEHSASSRSVSGEQWGEFLTRVFHRWRGQDIGKVFVQHFDMLLGMTLGQPASLCVHAPECGRAMALEHNGDLYSCDHFVTPGHCLGNIVQQPLDDMANDTTQIRFGRSKSTALPEECRNCPELHLCHGGCPKDRLIPTPSGPLNWLCAGYRRFYRETVPYFAAMANAYRRGLPASAYPHFMPSHHPITAPATFQPEENRA